MSWTEINSRNGGLPYGSVPYDRVSEKLEETDPDLVAEVRGFDEFHDVEDDYDDYVRSEIQDWTPDAPFLESDQPGRDPSLSRSTLNLHYGGTRGSDPDLPRHSEIFIGFMDQDPRGPDNEPRFEQIRGHMVARAADLTTSMGDNDDHHEAERPWTNQSISYAMKEVQRRVAGNTKIFAVQKEGRPWGRNVITDALAASAARSDLRSEALTSGGEGFAAQAWGGTADERFASGDHGPVTEAFTDGVRGADHGSMAGSERAPWRHTVGDADLGLHKYGRQSGAGRAVLGPAAQGGGRVPAARAEHTWAASRRGGGTNRHVLGATMALAAKSRGLAKSGQTEQDHGASYPGRMAGTGLMPSQDAARRHRFAVEDQARRPSTEIQDGAGGVAGGAGLVPAAHPERVGRQSQAAVTPNEHLSNVGAIVTGLREGTAASRRRIAGQIAADGARPHHSLEMVSRGGEVPGRDTGRLTHYADAVPVAGAGSGLEAFSAGGMKPSTDAGRLAHLTETLIPRSAAAGVEVQTYRGMAPAAPERRVAVGQGGYDPATWRGQYETAHRRTKMPEWRSGTQSQAGLGDDPSRVFGSGAEAFGGGAPTGPKTLRSGGWSDSARLTDDLVDGIGASA